LYRIWRWFNEEILHCSSPGKMEQGMNLEEITLLARCNGLHTQTFRAGEFNEMESMMRAKKIQYIDQNLLEHHKGHKSCTKIHEAFVNFYDP
jgi:hypothetical protein